MAFAAAFARPASSRFIRPGAASLWFPPRPFPALAWLVERPTASIAAVPGGAACTAGGSPASGQRYTQARGPAARDGGGTRAPRQRVPGEPPRLDLELRLLFSCSPLLPDEDFFMALRIELGQRAWSLEHAIGAPRHAWSATPGADSDLEKRRARLVTEVNLGLAIVESAPVRYPRPVRNVLLARQARHIGQRLADVLAHPAAGSLAEELTRLLESLRQHY
ncbi:MAG TPA: hypothetical protein VFU32_10800 [Ktedonobacterales bacterium]|nr:hypothetical protein [Ktedonobacterales bacterium]